MQKKKLKLLVCALAIGLCVSLANADIETGMVAYWPFEEGSGTTTADVTGHGHDGTFEQTPEWDSGPEGLGGALLFDVGDSGDGVHCGTACDPGDIFTLALWAYWNGNPAAESSVHFLTKSNGWGADTARWQWELFAGNSNPDRTDKIGISCKGNTPFGSVMLSAGAMPDNEWVHLTVTYDGAKATLFVNGVADSLGPQTFIIGTKTDADFFIGRPGWDYPRRSFDGYLDEVRVYSRPLTPEDVLELYEFRSAGEFNYAPKVDAGSYQSLLWPDNTAQLDGTVSDDGKPADPCEVTITWSQLSGPGTVQFSDTTIEDPTATFSAPGTYLLELEAFDGEKSNSDTVGIVIRPDNNPIAHWDFDEGSGPTVNDDSANNNEGTLAGTNEPNWVSGWIGSGAMEFYGVEATTVSSYVDITSDLLAPDPNLENLQYDITLSAWFRIDDLANTYYPAIIANGNQGWRLYMVHTAGDRFGKVLFTPGDGLLGARTESTRSLADGHWHHVVGIYDYLNSKSYLYIDGVLDNSEDNKGLMAAIDDKPVTIGARATSATEVERSWNGLLEDVRIYAYVLSAAQVADLTAMGDMLPIVDAGEDQTYAIQRGPLQFDATVTEDGVPAMSTLKWTADPCTATFSDDAIENPIVTFPEAGTYVLRLTADDTLVEAYDEVTITVVNPTCQDIIDDGLLATGDISGPDGTPDCRVNMYDFAAFAGYWLRCNDPQNPECELPY